MSQSLPSYDPFREETFAKHPKTGAQAQGEALHTCTLAQKAWSLRPAGERARMLESLEATLHANRQTWAELATREMGKPLDQALAELDKCAWLCRYYREHAEAMLAVDPRLDDPEDGTAYVRYDPLGLVLAIMPWNYPYWQVFRCAVPAITSGNGLLLKHASNVPGCALACEAAFAEAGYPEGLFKTLLVGADAIPALLEEDAVQAASLTGSEAAGRAVAEAAGRALKPCVLELGGSDPFIVLNDADLEQSVQVATKARLQNNGQSCIAAKRFIVEASVYEAFVEALVEGLEQTRMGDPLEEAVDLGPLAKAEFANDLEQLVQKSLDAGATLRFRANAPKQKAFFGPVVLENVQPGMPAFDEEAFGPVFALVKAEDADRAIALANQHRYGLGASLWTQDLDKAQALAARIESGQVFINRMVASDPRLPFGGIKQSGYGRELAREGLRAFTNAKTVAFPA